MLVKRARLVLSQSCSVLRSVVCRRFSIIVLILSLSSATSPRASTWIDRVRSPLVTAVATSAIARTWVVRLAAKRFTLPVRSFQVPAAPGTRSEEHTSELQSRSDLVCRLLLEKKNDRAAYRAALDAEVLMLDDLGTHRVTEWVEDTVTALITDRCNNRKPLIATTNLPDPEVADAIVERDSGLPQKVYAKVSLAERVGERARSRLFEMCRVVRMPTVEDYRLRKIAR